MDDVLYREEILEHASASPHRGRLQAPDHEAELDNPLCGDRLRMQLRLNDERGIDCVRFEGQGCAISQAVASMLAEWIEGKTLGQARRLSADDLLGRLGIRLSPARLKCALLSWRVLQAAIPSEVRG